MTPHWRDDVRALWAVGWPLILNNLFSMGVNVADTLMIGRLGATPLAALAIGSGTWVAIFLGGLGILMALGPTVSHHYGAQRLMQIGHDTRQAFWLAVVLSAIVCAALNHADLLLARLGLEPTMAHLAQDYLAALSWGVPASYGYHVLRQMNEGIGRTVPIMVVTGLGLGLNVAVSYVLVFGKFGFAARGVEGSGFGTALTFWGMFLLLLAYVVLHPAYARFALWRARWQPDWMALRALVVLGWPIGLSLLMQAGLFMALALMMGRLGATYAAAHQVTLNYAGIVFMLPLGIGFATAVLVGQAIGAGAPREARRIGLVGVSVCFGVAGSIAAVTLVGAEQIARLYTRDPQVIGLAGTLLLASAFLQWGDGTQSAASGALRGLKDTRVPMMINGVIYWGVGFTTAWSLGLGFGLGGIGIWAGLALALCTAAVVLTLRFRHIIGLRIGVEH